MDKQIWKNIIEGDHTAYEQLYYEYFKKFYNYGKKFTTDTALVEDSIQEVFMEIWTKREKILNIDSPNSYFFSAFRFILLEKIRQGKKLAGAPAEEDIEFSIELRIITQEVDAAIRQKLTTALESLTPRQREAVFLRFYEGLSYEEVASVLNISIKATYKIMARSLTSLKEQIGGPGLTSFIVLHLLIG